MSNSNMLLTLVQEVTRHIPACIGATAYQVLFEGTRKSPDKSSSCGHSYHHEYHESRVLY